MFKNLPDSHWVPPPRHGRARRVRVSDMRDEKLAILTATAGSGALGGIFTPTPFVGALCGALFGLGTHALWPAHTSASYAYAIVGMGAFLAGATQAPLMAILMIFEITLSYQVVLPLLVSCVVAYFVARATDTMSMYEVTHRRYRGSGAHRAEVDEDARADPARADRRAARGKRCGHDAPVPRISGEIPVRDRRRWPLSRCGRAEGHHVRPARKVRHRAKRPPRTMRTRHFRCSRPTCRSAPHSSCSCASRGIGCR